ncbi:MAG: ABC-2 family transporter protein [Clostridiales bacterium]|nr:ABC-2 family transporter protein [Clostridiales bacterium]
MSRISKAGKKLRIYLPFVNAGVQEASTYRANWFFYILGDVIGCFVSFFVWEAVFISNGGESFMGFDKGDMVVYIFLTFLTNKLISGGGTYDIGEEVKDGTIAMRMIKPISYNSTFLFQELGNKLMEIGIIFIPLTAGVEVYRFILTDSLQFNAGRFFLYLFCCVFAYLINFFFNICFGFTAFIFKNLWGSNMLKNCIVGFLSGSVIPLAFFPDAMKNVLSLLPFASLSYTPVMVYMGIYSGSEMLFYIGLQIFWCLAFWLLSKLVWKAVVKHLCVQGG